GLQELWMHLGSTDDAKALRALLKLAAVPPKESMPFLKKYLMPVKVDAKQIAQSLAKLDSDDFDERQKASENLEYLGEYAIAHLERALADNPSLEARQRMEQILAKVKPPATPSAWLRTR